MKTIVIGAGRMGRRHIQVAQQLSLDIVAVADPFADARAAAVKECGIADSALRADANEAIDAVRAECVIIATTAPNHCDLTVRAAGAGAKYILCEKPMAVSLAECDQMIGACQKSGTRLAVNHQMRFMEQYTQPKALLDSERMGGLTSVSVVAGNFGLAMNGSHYVEMFRYMTDEPAVRMSAWFSSEKVANPRGPQFEDRAGCIRAETASGKRFYMDASADQGHGMVVVYGARHGTIIVDELAGLMRVVSRDAEHRSMPTTRYGMPWSEELIKIAPADSLTPTKAVLSALLAGKDYPTGEDGRNAVAALVAAYESAENGGRTVSLDSSLPATRAFPWA